MEFMANYIEYMNFFVGEDCIMYLVLSLTFITEIMIVINKFYVIEEKIKNIV